MPDATVCREIESRETIERDLLAFITGPLRTRRQRSIDMACVDATTPLFESGLIDSLAILDLIAYVEAVTGRRIPLRQIDMRHFGSVARIVNTFFLASSECSESAGSTR